MQEEFWGEKVKRYRFWVVFFGVLSDPPRGKNIHKLRKHLVKKVTPEKKTTPPQGWKRRGGGDKLIGKEGIK